MRRSESGLRVPFPPGAKPGMHKIPSKCGSGLRKDYPVLLKKVKSALGVPSSIPQVSCGAVMKFLRKLSHRCDERLTPLQQADLWKKIQDFSVSSTSRDFMDFASFVQTIGWVRRTDFANIRLFSLQQHIKLPFENTAILCATMSKNLVSVILQRRKNCFFYDERDKTSQAKKTRKWG